MKKTSSINSSGGKVGFGGTESMDSTKSNPKPKVTMHAAAFVDAGGGNAKAGANNMRKTMTRAQMRQTNAGPHASAARTSTSGGSRSVQSVVKSGGQQFVVTETYSAVENCYVELGSTKTGFGENAIPEGVPFDMVISHIDREIQLKTSCKSLPYTVILYLCVIWSTWLKCDTYTYGVGSSVQEIFATIELHSDHVKMFQKEDQDGSRVSPRMLKAAGKGGSGGGNVGGGVTSPATLWAWINQGVIPLLWYEGNGRVRLYHKIIGGIRIRQTRAAEQDCESEALGEWYGPPAKCRSWAEKDLAPFGFNRSHDSAFSPSKVKDDVFEVWLPTSATQEQVQDRLMDLWQGGWVDHRTSVIAMEVGLYNGDVDAFAFTQYEFRFSSDGAVRFIPRIFTSNNQFRMWYYFAADTCVWILILGLIVTEFLEIHKAVKKGELWEQYFHGVEFVWNVCDWASMFLGTTTLSGYIWLDGFRQAVVDSVTVSFAKDVDGTHWSASVDKLSELCQLKKKHEVVLFFFLLSIMVRFFKAFRGQPRLAVLSSTFAKCCIEVFYFFIIFVAIFSNFVITGFLLFNSQIAEWSTLSKSINECFEILMGEFDFSDMYNVHPFAASLWFWAFMLLVLLITLSMLLAVILETYSVVKVELSDQSSEGMFTQLYYLALQSRWYRILADRIGAMRENSEGGWSSIEKVREDLTAMEGASRLTLMRDKKFMGQHVVFRVTRGSFKKIGLPKGQIDFFWKVFRKQIADQAKEEEKKEEEKKAKEKKAAADADTQDTIEEEDPAKEMMDMVQKLEKRVASNEAAMRLGLSQIFMKMSNLDGKQPW